MGSFMEHRQDEPNSRYELSVLLRPNLKKIHLLKARRKLSFVLNRIVKISVNKQRRKLRTLRLF